MGAIQIPQASGQRSTGDVCYHCWKAMFAAMQEWSEGSNRGVSWWRSLNHDTGMKWCGTQSELWHRSGAAEGRVWRILTLQLPTLLNAENNRRSKCFCCVLFAATWLGQRCAEADMLVQGQPGLRMRCGRDVVATLVPSLEVPSERSQL